MTYQFQTVHGATSLVQCFYECKPHPVAAESWNEVTTLMIANGRQPMAPLIEPHAVTHVASIAIIDGNENIRYVTKTELTPRDLDEVNICATIGAAGAADVPSAGLIQIAIEDVSGAIFETNPVAIWMKNVLGRMSMQDPEPFNGRVRGVGKTRCAEVEDDALKLLGDPEFQQAPIVDPVLIEGTAD